jgi:hypothetical protein
MLLLSAWICHANAVNQNGMAFLEEDLKTAVDNGLFNAPFLGMIDFNHDFNAYGCWYSARYTFDPVAQQYGILAEGALFAWRYESLADRVLAMQDRLGFVNVSMACIPEYRQVATAEDGSEYVILRNPTFFTTSLLDVAPADPYGRGSGSEDPTSTSEERLSALLKAEVVAAMSHLEDESMDPKELIAKVEELMGDYKAELVPLVEAALKLPGVETQLRAAVAAAEAASKRHAETEHALTASQATVESLTSEKATAEVALAAAKAELEKANEELTALRAFQAETEAAAAEAATAERRDQRLAEVPDATKAALEAREDKEAVIKAWTEQTPDQWALTLETFRLASVDSKRSRFAARSAAEGTLSAATDTREGKFSIDRYTGGK